MLLASIDDPRLDGAAPPGGPAATPPRATVQAPSAAAQRLGTRREHPRVLVVEDDPICLRGICRNLRLAGYEVLSAGDGVEALAAVKEHGADVIVTDLMMPKMNGVDLILQLAMAKPRVPVIAITGSDDYEGCIKPARLFGAARVFRKPFGSQSLLSAIASAPEEG